MMFHWLFEEGDWFAPKGVGYGSGLPTAWQGWALTGLYHLAVIGAVVAVALGGSVAAIVVGMSFIIAISIAFLMVVRRHTPGGWRWRSGGED